MKVNIERVYELKRELNEINLQQLEDIQLYGDGELIDIPQHNIDAWRYIGLSNVEFITTIFYEENINE